MYLSSSEGQLLETDRISHLVLPHFITFLRKKILEGGDEFEVGGWGYVVVATCLAQKPEEEKREYLGGSTKMIYIRAFKLLNSRDSIY